MKVNYAACRAFVRKYEGGYSDVRFDPGNWTGGKVGVGILKGTKYGIAAASYPTVDIADLTMDEADAIYRRDYWDKVSGDSLPAGVDLAVFDLSVNSGVGKGRSVYAACRNITADPAELVKAICGKRLAFLQGLATFAKFGRGWSARVTACEALALRMVMGARGVAVPEQNAQLRDEAAKARQDAGVAKVGAGATAAGAAGSSVGAASGTSLGQFLTIALILAAITALALWRAHTQTARAVALQTEGQGHG